MAVLKVALCLLATSTALQLATEEPETWRKHVPVLKGGPANFNMPMLGFGTCCRPTANGPALTESTLAYLKNGGKLIDTAYMYGNHEAIGKALKESGLPAGSVWITDKILPDQMTYEKAQSAVDQSLRELGVSSLDLMLIHIPEKIKENRVNAWKGLIESQKQGKVKHIGVSNFNQEQIEELIEATGQAPANNQIEFNPFAPKEVKDFVSWMQEKGISVTAYGSVGHNGPGRLDALAKEFEPIRSKHGKSVHQVLLRWALDKGIAVIPGATTEDHIKEDLNIVDFALAQDETSLLEAHEMPTYWPRWHEIPGA